MNIQFLLKLARSGANLRELTPTELAQLFTDDLTRKGEPQIDKESLIAVASLIKGRVKLKILILGPGQDGGDVYTKRCELRDWLTRLGHEAHFCEEVWTRDALERSGLNLTVAEYIQALVYDYIVCLMGSPGSIGEAHDFAKDRRIAVKMMICIDDRHRRGYSALGLIRIFEGYNGKVDWFTYPSDITDCHLATRVVDHIEKVAERKQWELASGGKIS